MELMAAHENWASRPADERFSDLKKLHAAVAKRDGESKDAELSLAKAAFDVTPTGAILKNAGVKTARFTHWSFGQMARRLGVPGDFLPELTPKVAADVLNDRLARYLSLEDGDPTGRCLLATNGETTVRALHGGHYGTDEERIWDSDVTKLLMEELPDGWRNPVAYKGGEWGAELVPSGLYAGDRDMFAFLINGGDQIDLGGRDQFHSGFFISNSEVGARRFSVTRFNFRVVCGNNIVWGADDLYELSIRHTKNAKATAVEFLANFLRTLDEADHGAAFGRSVKAARDMMFAPITKEGEDDAIELCRKRGGFRKYEAEAALEAIRREEPKATGSYWDWMQGFTAVARTMQNADRRVKLETRASRLFLPAITVAPVTASPKVTVAVAKPAAAKKAAAMKPAAAPKKVARKKLLVAAK